MLTIPSEYARKKKKGRPKRKRDGVGNSKKRE